MKLELKPYEEKMKKQMLLRNRGKARRTGRDRLKKRHLYLVKG